MQGNTHKTPNVPPISSATPPGWPGQPPSGWLGQAGVPDRPAFGTAVSEAILMRVAAGELGATFRLHRPAREVAFAKQDRAADGFAEAVSAARAAGFDAVVRLAGGRAALFHEGTLASPGRARPSGRLPRPRPVRADRRDRRGGAAAARGRRADRRGAGRVLPGAWSVNARGAVKLAGIGQRIVAGGAHVGGVLVVTDAPCCARRSAPSTPRSGSNGIRRPPARSRTRPPE